MSQVDASDICCQPQVDPIALVEHMHDLGWVTTRGSWDDQKGTLLGLYVAKGTIEVLVPGRGPRDYERRLAEAFNEFARVEGIHPHHLLNYVRSGIDIYLPRETP